MACKDFIKQCLKRKTIVHSDESDWFLTRHEQCSEKIYITPELQKTFEAQNSAEYVEISQPAFISSVSGKLRCDLEDLRKQSAFIHLPCQEKSMAQQLLRTREAEQTSMSQDFSEFLSRIDRDLTCVGDDKKYQIIRSMLDKHFKVNKKQPDIKCQFCNLRIRGVLKNVKNHENESCKKKK